MVSFGIVGTNFISDRFIEGARLVKGVKIEAVCSRQLETANAFADKHSIPLRFDQYETMLNSHINAVYIASPTNLHVHYARLALQQGKHVLCEKPVTSNAKELKELISLAEQHQVVFMEAMKSTCMPGFTKLKESLSEIGTIRRYFASFCQYSSRYDAYKAGEVLNAFKPEFSNGALMDIGVYCIYPAILLFGKPKAIKASAYMLESGVDGEGSVILEYENMQAVVMFSKISDSSLPMEIQGEAGNLLVDKVSQPTQVWKQLKGEQATQIAPFTEEHNMCYEVESFVEAINTNQIESSINTHATSLAVMEVLDEIRQQIGLVFPADK